MASKLASLKQAISRVGIVGVPFNKGQRLNGVALGPKFIRNGGLVENIKEFNHNVDIRDFGDVQEDELKIDEKLPENMLNYKYHSATMKQLSDKVLNVLNDDRICWNLGGDHSIAVGTVSGHLRHNANISLIWVDAHTDINTNQTSMSGNVHGMPVALLAKELREYWNPLPGFDWLKPHT